MKLEVYKEVIEDSPLVHQLCCELESKLWTIYRFSDPRIIGQMRNIFRLMDPKGKTVLDLGCGSRNSGDSQWRDEYTPYEPWLLRALHEYGANCIGIDIGGLDGERFSGFKRDLSRLNSLEMLKTHSVDIACAFSFFDSPSLLFGGKHAFRNLLPQLERVVKPEGFFLFDELCSGYQEAENLETATQ